MGGDGVSDIIHFSLLYSTAEEGHCDLAEMLIFIVAKFVAREKNSCRSVQIREKLCRKQFAFRRRMWSGVESNSLCMTQTDQHSCKGI